MTFHVIYISTSLALKRSIFSYRSFSIETCKQSYKKKEDGMMYNFIVFRGSCNVYILYLYLFLSSAAQSQKKYYIHLDSLRPQKNSIQYEITKFLWDKWSLKILQYCLKAFKPFYLTQYLTIFFLLCNLTLIQNPIISSYTFI